MNVDGREDFYELESAQAATLSFSYIHLLSLWSRKGSVLNVRLCLFALCESYMRRGEGTLVSKI